MRVLIVDDNKSNQELYCQYLQNNIKIPTTIHIAENGRNAINLINSEEFDCILLNYHLPDMHGIDLLEALKNKPDFFYTPIITLTDQGNEQAAVEILKRGAYDYLIRDKTTAEILQRSISSATEKAKLLRRIDLQQKEIERMAYYDYLTGIPNRLQFERAANQALSRAKRHEQIMSIMMIDLDYFKKVNDSYGHEVGDKILQQASKRLLECIRNSDLLARLGGDEFAIILDNMRTPEAAGIVAEKLLNVMSAPFQVNGYTAYISISVGIACFPEAGDSLLKLMQNADIALYQAKAKGRDNFQYFSSDASTHGTQLLILENNLHGALERQQLYLQYQPIIQINTQKIIGLEALLRWTTPDLGQVPPEVFIPVAEETGLIIAIGEWVVEQVCQQYLIWQKQGIQVLQLALNLSARQLAQSDLAEKFLSILKKYNISPKDIIFELTETAILKNSAQAKLLLQQFQDKGFKTFLDDFGTGYSSMQLLQELPISGLKIDKSFTQKIYNNDKTANIVKSMLTLAENLNMAVIVEGIEAREQLDFFEKTNCQYAQGFYLAKPLDVNQITDLLKKGSK